jgi:signal transduction histidine kinase
MGFIIPAILYALASSVILILFFRIPRREQILFRGSVATSVIISCLSLSFILPTEWQVLDFINRNFIASILAIGVNISVGVILFSYVSTHPRKQRLQNAWYIGSAIWLISYIIGAIVSHNLPENTLSTFPPQAITMFIGLLGIGILEGALVIILLWDYYRVTLPELANRSAYWIFVSLFCSTGVALILSTLPSLIIAGLTFTLIALLGVFYGYRKTRFLDVRLGFIISIRNLTLIALLTLCILVPTYIVDKLDFINGLTEVFTVIGVATIVAAICLPFLQLIRDIYEKLTATTQTDLSAAIAAYSREVSLSTRLDEVVTATTTTLNHVLNIKRSGLVLISSTFRKENAVEFVVLSGAPAVSGSHQVEYVSKDSPIYLAFSRDRRAVTQYDIDFDPQFASITPRERKFFQSMYLRAFAPIVTENNLIGIIGCGPKLDDTAYTAGELELLIVIGQQIGTALRSARLIDDLRHLNTSMQSLNSQLQVAKQDLEKLDGIKTDFITIASHELRTPLAQVRGYTDIIDSLNDQGILEQKQTKTLANNLRRATERIEELISAMMDVSQLDVNAMDLNFVRTKPETIIKLALDPLRDAIEQRKLKVEYKDLTDLPAIQADMQRMVQAVSNIIVNAIKFTPDSGSIMISGKSEVQNNADYIVLIIKDTGVGIHNHDLDLIFQKFYRGFDPQLHSTGTYKFMGAGPGLGTTIAKGIIEGHGGKIWAESTGHDMKTFPGATFYISMPVNPPEDARRVMPFDPEDSIEAEKTAEFPVASVSTTETQLVGSEKPTEAKKPIEG